ncbi:hypothetical protein HMPREF1986_01186 [Oribacterium sp. oral taxon 078 str. F0263]|nr:hypothetical protein HMPREF1986_01186 [Oribacterium sp. oral taxon 078 str. F0263]
MRFGRECSGTRKCGLTGIKRRPGHRIAALFGVRMLGDNSFGRRVIGEKKSPGKGGVRSGGRV